MLKHHLSRLPVAISRALEGRYLSDERLHVSDLLRQSEQKFRILTETVASAVFICHGLQLKYANHAAELITEYSSEELLSMPLSNLLHPDCDKIVPQIGQRGTGEDLFPVRCDAKIITKSGKAKWLDLVEGIVRIDGICGTLITALDITSRKQLEEEIFHLAASDPLTGLANYRRLVEAFDLELDRSQRTGQSFGVVLLDLDDLKGINDKYGHLTGSRALCRVGNVLRHQCRSLDVPARYGGDEFAVILPESNAEASRCFAQRVADRIRSDGETPPISLSFGIAICREDGETFADIFQMADAGLYLMKGQHRINVAS